MAKTDTTTIKMTRKGNKYQIENTKQDRLESVFAYARDTMTSPCAFHLISHIYEPELFEITKRSLVRSFERALKRQYKALAQLPSKSTRRQQCPKTVIAFSIEFKYTSQKEIDGDSDTYDIGNVSWKKTDEKLPFLHIHFYVIADCNNTIPMDFHKHAMEALNELKGLRAARYAKTIDDKKYKPLNTDYDDAVLRAFYIGKIEQKSTHIPYRNTFGTSHIK